MKKGVVYTALGFVTGLALAAWFTRPKGMGIMAGLIPVSKPAQFATKLSDELWNAIVSTAGRIGADPTQLAQVINFESNGFNPQAINPYSGASGLIQFMPSTAARLGTSVEAIRQMTALQQMPLVEQYFKMTAGSKPLNTFQALTMAVFYPKFMDVPPNTPFPSNVVAVNPGIYTPAHYMDKVLRKT